MYLHYDIEDGNFAKAGMASSEVKRILRELSIEASIIKRVVIALYEGEVNVVAHANGGKIAVDIDGEKIRVVISDSGPGIPDIEQAMQVGYSTASDAVRAMGFGAGMGLPNMKKNSDELNIQSTVGKGTTVEMINYFGKK